MKLAFFVATIALFVGCSGSDSTSGTGGSTTSSTGGTGDGGATGGTSIGGTSTGGTSTGGMTTGGSGGAQTTSSSTGTGIAGPGCPDLTGEFQCPAVSGQPAFTLTMSQTFDGTTTNYSFHYSNSNTTLAIPASDAGVSKDGYTGQCMPHGGVDSLALYPDGKPAQATYNFINGENDYQADVGNSPAITCVRTQ